MIALKPPNDCQIELIDMQCDLTFEGNVSEFPESAPKKVFGPKDFFGGLSEDNFPHLKDFVKKLIVLFGSIVT